MPKIMIEEQEIFYTQRKGPAAAPAVLLIHGAGGSHLDWPAELRRLPGAAIYALDLPGHGRSAPPGREMIGAYADVVAAFIEKLALDQVLVAGHSMGGAIAQVLALRHRPPLAGLILLATGARLRVSDVILDRPPGEFEQVVDFVMKYAWSPDAPEEVVQAARALLRENDPVTVRGDFAACNRFDVQGTLGGIGVPTLVIGGTEDRMTPLKYSHYLAAQIPGARLETVEGGSHMMALEQPEVVAGAVQAFVEGRKRKE